MKRIPLLLTTLTLLVGLGGSLVAQSSGSKTFTGTGEGIGPIQATVQVDARGVVTSVELVGPQETASIGGEALSKLERTVIEAQSASVDGVAGATYTSQGAKAAVADALKKAGIDSNRAAKVGAAKVAEVYNADVVIVGAGTAGTGAALAATEAGSKVLVLEKLPRVGGLATTGMGILATESSLQKAAGQTVTTEAIFQHLASYNHYRSNLALTKVILDKSGSTVDWLIQNGIGLRLGLGIDQKRHLDYPKTYHMWTNSKEDFPRVYARLQKERGLTLLLETRGEQLLKDDQGRIVGVTGHRADGTPVRVNAKAVVVATGGFGGDSELVKASTNLNQYNYFGLGNQGDGVKMSWAVGADDLGNHAFQIHLGDLAGSKTIFDRYFDNGVSQVKDVPLLWVNKEGSRFVDESVVYDNVLWGNAAFSVGGEYFTIADQASFDRFAKEGIKMTGAYQMNGSGLMHPEGKNDTNITIAPLTNLAADVQALLKVGDIVYKAETLDQLAGLTGMSPTKLARTVDLYNKAVADKKDGLFYKKAEYLQYSVKTGPFYAIRVRGSAYGSLGGVRINEDIQALDQNQQPIPGLYVAGSDAGGMYDNSYPDLEGLTMGFAINSGRIAGENAAKAAQK